MILWQVDPYLELVDNISLHAVIENPAGGRRIYGSEEDDFAALKSLSVVESDDQKLKETVIFHLMSKFEKLSEVNGQHMLLFPMSVKPSLSSNV